MFKADGPVHVILQAQWYQCAYRYLYNTLGTTMAYCPEDVWVGGGGQEVIQITCIGTAAHAHVYMLHASLDVCPMWS